jgi:hypothetical protein
MPYDNDMALTQALVADFSNIVNEVADEVWIKLNEEIQHDVYDAFDPTWYERQGVNGGLLYEFEKSNPSTVGNTITSEIGENPDRLTLNPDRFIHGSLYWKNTDDIRDMLVDIILAGSDSSKHPHVGQAFNFPDMPPRDFWTPFIDKLDKGLINDLIEASFNKRGLSWIRI